MKPDGKESEIEVYPVIIKHLPPKFAKKAEMQLFETPKKIESGIREIRNLLKSDEALKSEWYTDEDIIMYLRSKKHDVRKAITTMRKMAALIKRRKIYFEPIQKHLLEFVLREGALSVLPRRDKDGALVLFAKLRSWEPSVISLDGLITCLCLVITYYTKFPMNQVNGVKVIYDFEAPFFKYLKYYTPHTAYRFYQIIIECSPVRVKAIHLVNPNGLSKIMVPVVLALISEKLAKRIKLHEKPSDLLNYFDADLVPAEYGGQLTEKDRNDLDLIGFNDIKHPDYVNYIYDYVRTSSCS